MILRLYPRLWLCRPLDRAIIVRALVSSSNEGEKGKQPTSRTFDLRVKLRASEGKNCDQVKQFDKLTQEHTEVKVGEKSPRFDRIVKRDPTLTLIKRLEKIDGVEQQQGQNHPDSIFKGGDNTGQVSPLDREPSLTQCDTKVIPGERLLENLPKRVLTPVTMRIPEGLEKTIEVFRDFPDQYPFLRSD